MGAVASGRVHALAAGNLCRPSRTSRRRLPFPQALLDGEYEPERNFSNAPQDFRPSGADVGVTCQAVAKEDLNMRVIMPMCARNDGNTDSRSSARSTPRSPPRTPVRWTWLASPSEPSGSGPSFGSRSTERGRP